MLIKIRMAPRESRKNVDCTTTMARAGWASLFNWLGSPTWAGSSWTTLPRRPLACPSEKKGQSEPRSKNCRVANRARPIGLEKAGRESSLHFRYPVRKRATKIRPCITKVKVVGEREMLKKG